MLIGWVIRSGNSYKSMTSSLEASLKKLGTSYVDVLCAWIALSASRVSC